MPETTRGHAEGGVWETLLEEAAMRVTTYLTSSTQPFDQRAPVAQAMLLLLDRPTLREIVMERNYNGLCGRLGCAQAPRATFGATSKPHARCTSEASSSSEDDLMGCGGNDDEDEEAMAVAAQRARQAQQHQGARTTAGTNEAEEEEEEVVYEDDVFIEEGFRLAARQQRQLARMRRAAQRARDAAARRAQGTNNEAHVQAKEHRNNSTAPAAHVTLPRFEERFCSPECVDLYVYELRPCVRPCAELNDPHLLPALATLFPNIRPDVLHRLASAETAQSAKGILGPVVEKNTREQPVSATENNAHGEQTGEKEKSSEVQREMTQLLRMTLQEMHVLQRVWSTGSDSPSFRARPPEQGSAHEEEQRALQAREVVAGASEASHAALKHASLRGPLLVIDACLDFATRQTRLLFVQQYKAHRAGIQAALQQACELSGPSHISPLHVRLVRPVIDALEACLGQDGSNNSNNSNSQEDRAGKVHAPWQLERRELFASHLFSTETSAALSRLLQFDYHVLIHEAWTRVWLSAHGGCALLCSLDFPFAIPGPLLRPAATTREVLMLATVLLLSTLCASEAVWQEFARQLREAAEDKESEEEEEEEGAEQEPLAELLRAMAVSEDDVRAALRALVLCDS